MWFLGVSHLLLQSHHFRVYDTFKFKSLKNLTINSLENLKKPKTAGAVVGDSSRPSDGCSSGLTGEFC